MNVVTQFKNRKWGNKTFKILGFVQIFNIIHNSTIGSPSARFSIQPDQILPYRMILCN